MPKLVCGLAVREHMAQIPSCGADKLNFALKGMFSIRLFFLSVFNSVRWRISQKSFENRC